MWENFVYILFFVLFLLREIHIGISDQYNTFCKIKFATADMAKSALNLKDTLIGEYKVQIQNYTKKVSDLSLSLFVGNLSPKTTLEMVRSSFSDCKPIKSLRLIKRNGKNNLNSFAKIEFDNIISYEKALSLNKLIIDEKKIYVKPINTIKEKKL